MIVEIPQSLQTKVFDPQKDILKEIDVLTKPDNGGSVGSIENLNSSLVIAETQERIYIPVESQKASKEETLSFENNPPDFKEDLAQIGRLQEIFDRCLGIESKKGKIYSYNPVLERWKFEQLKTEEEKNAFRDEYEIKQIQTALRERYSAKQSVVLYELDEEGNVYSPDFPDENLDVVWQRGIVYRKEQGLPNNERDQKEFESWVKVRKKLADPDTPLKSKMYVISEPGEGYEYNFVDFFELDHDPLTKKRFIIMSRFASSLSEEQYKSIVISQNPDYFKKSYYLLEFHFKANPIFIDSKVDPRSSDELFTQIFKAKNDSTSEKDIQQILEQSHPLANYLKDMITAEKFDPKEIALAWNAVLKMSELIKDRLERIKIGIVNKVDQFIGNIATTLNDIKKQVKFYGIQQVKEKAGPCGDTGGFSFGRVLSSVLSGATSFISSLKSFVEGSSGLSGTCKECGGSSADNHYHCPGCGRKYADETNKSQRTRVCEKIKNENGKKCGFEFGC